MRWLPWVVLGVCMNASAQPGMLMPPYLQAVTPTRITVLIESTTADPITVVYGSTMEHSDSVTTTGTETTDAQTVVHRIRLTGLKPNTLYHYRAHRGRERSPDATFRTAPEQGTSFRFGWMADCRSGTAVHDSIARRIAEADPVVLLYGGDLAVSSSYAAYKAEFFRPAEQALIARVPFFNAVGNHEGWTTNTRAFTEGPPSASGTQAFYSFDYGDMHVVVLNTQLPFGAGSPQYAFVAKDLAATTRLWKVVIAHTHAYCAGGHGEDTGMIAMTTRIFEPDHVDLVLSGHSHFYQHNLVNGIHHLVIGSAGAVLYVPESKWYTLVTAKEYNYAIGDVSPAMLRLYVYNERGATLDSLILQKSAGDEHRSVPGIKGNGSLGMLQVPLSEPAILLTDWIVGHHSHGAPSW